MNHSFLTVLAAYATAAVVVLIPVALFLATVNVIAWLIRAMFSS